jgi:hypothetical protein
MSEVGWRDRYSVNSPILPTDISEVDSSIRRYRARFCNKSVFDAQLSDDARTWLSFTKLTANIFKRLCMRFQRLI